MTKKKIVIDVKKKSTKKPTQKKPVQKVDRLADALTLLAEVLARNTETQNVRLDLSRVVQEVGISIGRINSAIIDLSNRLNILSTKQNEETYGNGKESSCCESH